MNHLKTVFFFILFFLCNTMQATEMQPSQKTLQTVDQEAKDKKMGALVSALVPWIVYDKNSADKNYRGLKSMIKNYSLFILKNMLAFTVAHFCLNTTADTMFVVSLALIFGDAALGYLLQNAMISNPHFIDFNFALQSPCFLFSLLYAIKHNKFPPYKKLLEQATENYFDEPESFPDQAAQFFTEISEKIETETLTTEEAETYHTALMELANDFLETHNFFQNTLQFNLLSCKYIFAKLTNNQEEAAIIDEEMELYKGLTANY